MGENTPVATAAAQEIRQLDSLPPPVERIGALRWMRDNLFNNTWNGLLTIVSVVMLFYFIPPILKWAFVGSVWQTEDSSVCRHATGACWAVITDKHRVMFFGLYPFEEHWRALLALIIYVGTIVLSGWRRMWNLRILVPLWILAVVAILTLMVGGVLGLKYVETDQWGGLPLTMVIFTATMVIGMPMAVLLALGRRSEMPVIKVCCVMLIELLRGVPLVTVLFTAAVVFPLVLPTGVDIDKMIRIVIGMGIFFGCYQAEVIRGGLQAIPKGQYEAAASIGLSYWQTSRKIILPQALRIVIPGLMNHVISAFKNSTLVIIVGLFDLLNATSAAIADPLWINYYTEGYLFVAMVYFCGAVALSRYSQHLERWLSEGRRF